MPSSTARKPAAKKSPAASAKPKPAAKKVEEPKLHGMTKTERKAAATKIAKMRKDGIAWDTPDTGICAVIGIRTALVGRAILREFDNADLIKPLTGMRAK
jgi:hypothetical protein